MAISTYELFSSVSQVCAGPVLSLQKVMHLFSGRMLKRLNDLQMTPPLECLLHREMYSHLAGETLATKEMSVLPVLPRVQHLGPNPPWTPSSCPSAKAP